MRIVDVIDSTVAANAMHPDCLLMQQHVGIKSPRLSSNIDIIATKEKTFKKQITLVENSSDTKMMALNERFEDEEEEDEERMQISRDGTVLDAEDDGSDIDADALSIGSEDSELSVGCENALVAEDTSSPIMNQTRYNNARDVMNLSGPKKLLTDSKDEPSVHLNPSVMDPFAMANALHIPVPVVLRTQSTPFQEEFIRKSHLYAEELVKQQMQIMAAARANALQLRNAGMSMNVESDGKSKFHALSQLTAISKMSQLAAAAVVAANTKQVHTQAELQRATEATLNAYATETHRFSSQMPTVSSLQQLQVQMQAHWPYMQDTQSPNNANADNNENLQEPALKFSIDNILKADFGRRMNESLLNFERENMHMRNAEQNLPTAKKSNGSQKSNKQNLQKESVSPAPMDLTSLMNNATTTATANTGTLNFCNTLANICTNSNDSSTTVLSSNAGGSVESIGGSVKSPSESMHKQHDNGNNKNGENNNSNGTNSTSSTSSTNTGNGPIVWPAWVYCTRYSDRPSSGRSPRTRKPKKSPSEKGVAPVVTEDKRPRTAFSGSQLARLKNEFTENRYLTEKRRQQLSSELGLNEAQIKIWFQNKRAKLKKSSGTKNPLALQLMAQGLYNHSTVPLTREEEELQELQERENAAAEAAAAAAASCNSSVIT